MQIIPVIDLKNDEVVHARLGNRNQYQPINSPLCKSSKIFDVITAYIELHPFEVIYIADLNALTNRGDHFTLLNKVLNAFSSTTFWIDAGFPSGERIFSQKNHIPIIGSESFVESRICILNDMDDDAFILSLDFSTTNPLGPEKLFENPSLWPKNIIIMTLDKVGSNTGPALNKLQNYCEDFPDKNIIAAGGIRNISDVILLKKTGVTQVLVATALHNGAISPAILRNL